MSSLTHNPEKSQFELHVDDQLAGILQYRLDGTVATMFHTEVYPDKRGSGGGAALAHTALETARAAGWSVIPSCSFVAGYIRAHSQYQDLIHRTS